jgi:hypothetical protein
LTKALSRPTSVGRTTELSFLNTSPGNRSMSWRAQHRVSSGGNASH